MAERSLRGPGTALARASLMRALGLALVLAGCSGHEYVDNLMHADIVTAQIAASYVTHHEVAVADLPQLID